MISKSGLTSIGKIGLLLMLPIVPASLSAWLHPDEAKISDGLTVQIHTASVVLFLDARSEEARRQKSLPWTIRLTEETWEQDLPNVLDSWIPKAQLIVFCDSGSCNRSAQVAGRLRRETSLERISVLEGGEAAAIKLRTQLSEGVSK